MDSRWDFIDSYLEKRKRDGLLREPVSLEAAGPGGRIVVRGRMMLNLASNDYLGLRGDPRLREAAGEAAEVWGAGSGSSRLVSGTTEIHEGLEEELARFHGTESAVTFSSGYAAGAGVIQALCGQGRASRVYLDRLCHACLYDGARLAGAGIRRFRHNDPDHLEYYLREDRALDCRKLVVTDTVFSMDGDRAPLAELALVCRKYSVLFLVDEAHAVGVLGPGGRGLAAKEGLESEDVLVMGTLGKAFGVSGAYLACPRKVRSYLVNTCRSFIYSTAPPPALIAAVRASLEIITGADSLRTRLTQTAARFRSHLARLGVDTLASSTQIVPAVVGEVPRAVRMHEKLKELGVFAPAIRPPTVPEGTSRVRFSLTAALDDRDTEFLLQAVTRAVEGL
ncbi:MAG: 8-amino-7-oxononanoate synthase [Gemmatimonadota bacterium]|nr:8-amino-7-oxononanoate synthase [Gemmatimonadota bacterium]